MSSGEKRNNQAMVAIVDDDEAARSSLSQMLRLRKYGTEVFPRADAAMAWPGLKDVDCIISDVKMPGMDGEAFLSELLRQEFGVPVIMLTGHGDVPMAVRCLKNGAYDFVEKPFDDEVLLASVGRAVETAALRRESNALRQRIEKLSLTEDGRFGMVGRSRVMQDVYQQIDVFARSDAPVLIFGETGVGKELVAQALHAQSPRAAGPFVAVNAGALSETVLESELFGHARGAFTGAVARRDGKLLTASGGTLLLDEVETLSSKAQVQLLRVLEDGLVEAVGEDRPRKVNVRLVATTKEDLNELVRQGRLREDFYHRIVVLTIVVPPLRDRLEDVPLLVSHYISEACNRMGMPPCELPEETLGLLLRHPWPGNVRELRNAVERMVVTSRQGVAGPFLQDENFTQGRLLSLPATPGMLRQELERTERVVIENVLRQSRGEINATSRALGISRRALYERMKKYDLHKEDFRS